MKDIIKLTLVITIISVIAALIIAFTFVKTKDTIAAGQKQAQEEALKLVVPEGFEISEKTGDDSSVPQQYWVAEKGDEVLYIFKIASTGYSSNIVYLVSIDTNGGIQGMTVTEQSETPDLGQGSEVISKKYIWNGLLVKKKRETPRLQSNSRESTYIMILPLINQWESGINSMRHQKPL